MSEGLSLDVCAPSTSRRFAPSRATMRSGLTELLRGEPVAVEERRDSWARIRSAYDYPGWVREDEVRRGRPGRRGAADADQKGDAGATVDEADIRPGDLVTYAEGGETRATHIAFWLGDGRILHPTQRHRVDGVVEELEPEHLKEMRRRIIRL